MESVGEGRGKDKPFVTRDKSLYEYFQAEHVFGGRLGMALLSIRVTYDFSGNGA